MTQELKHRKDVHLARKIWHFVGAIIILILYHNIPRPLAVPITMALGGFMLLFDLVRLRNEKMNSFAISLLRPFMRESEVRSLSGLSYMIMGVFIIIYLFPATVVKLSLLFLAVADPVASYFGIRYGKDRLFDKKSLQGTAAAFVACTLISAGYFISSGIMVERLVVVSVLSGLSGAFSEVVPLGKLDDNLVLPVLSSVLLWIIYYVFGGL